MFFLKEKSIYFCYRIDNVLTNQQEIAVDKPIKQEKMKVGIQKIGRKCKMDKKNWRESKTKMAFSYLFFEKNNYKKTH